MNRDWVLLHLAEAQEELTRTIHQIRNEPDYEYCEFWPSMQSLYHHLNTAWNSRDATPAQVDSHSYKELKQWTKFPTDLPMADL